MEGLGYRMGREGQSRHGKVRVLGRGGWLGDGDYGWDVGERREAGCPRERAFFLLRCSRWFSRMLFSLRPTRTLGRVGGSTLSIFHTSDGVAV